jgi:hypothetical protein
MYSLYKTEKFIEKSNSFLFITFLSNSQKNLVNFKQKLQLNNLTLKFLKSKRILPFLNKYFKLNQLKFLLNISKGPSYVIQNFKTCDVLSDNLSDLTTDSFIKNKMFVVLYFFRGKIYTANTVFSIQKQNNLVKFLNAFTFRNKNLVITFKIAEILLIKLIYIFLYLK